MVALDLSLDGRISFPSRFPRIPRILSFDLAQDGEDIRLSSVEVLVEPCLERGLERLTENCHSLAVGVERGETGRLTHTGKNLASQPA